MNTRRSFFKLVLAGIATLTSIPSRMYGFCIPTAKPGLPVIRTNIVWFTEGWKRAYESDKADWENRPEPSDELVEAAYKAMHFGKR